MPLSKKREEEKEFRWISRFFRLFLLPSEETPELVFRKSAFF